MKPFRIHFGTIGTPIEELRANASANFCRPRVQFCAPHGRKLAIVGGGPGLIDQMETLRTWEGDIWAINFTVDWLIDQGIDAMLFTVDSGQMTIRAKRGILASYCHPSMFEREALAFDPLMDGGEIVGGSTSATTAPWLSLKLGYTDVSFFGCEGSFKHSDHVDRNEDHAHQLIVRAGDTDYRTRPDYLIQCDELARLFTNFPTMYHNRSGGLVQAMIEHPETWEIVAVSAAMKRHLEEINGAHSLYEGVYVPAGVAA